MNKKSKDLKIDLQKKGSKIQIGANKSIGYGFAK